MKFILDVFTAAMTEEIYSEPVRIHRVQPIKQQEINDGERERNLEILRTNG